jgi:prepilin-type N-terminal cleavage/methylation domain-containing protein/prepilin-type processing-associated H-X9-DG protein
MKTWPMCIVRGHEGRRGFTLVELLVVVSIIGVLMGLLLPAVMRARARARVVQCVNRQKELASAIIQYDHAKNRLPGYVNRVGPTNTIVSWAPMLFPYIGRMDLWEGSNGWRNGNTSQAPDIEQFVCPDDVEASGPRLSYVVNVGLYTDRDNPVASRLPATAIFRDYSGGTTGAKSLSDVGSHSQTIMLGEIHVNRRWDNAHLLQPAAWLSAYGFVWPDPTVPALQPAMIGKNLPVSGSSNILYGPLQTIQLPNGGGNTVHTGIVIAAFCDGHVESINNEALCREYRGSL